MKLISILFLSFLPLFANSFMPEKINIINVSDEKATIQKGNLAIGQSGVVIHNFSNNKTSILSYATVVDTNNNTSTIQFLDDKVIPQDAIPTIKLKPSKGDIFIINHLYTASLMIVPNFEAEQAVRNLYPNHSFLSSDIFAGFLKINETPVPTKKMIHKFAKSNNLGSILFYIKDKLYLVDTLSFKIIRANNLPIKDKKTMSPFLTNVKNIETGVFDFTSLEKIEDYDKYYKELLGIKNGK